MAKDIFDTILEKDYYQLTSIELAEIADFCKNEEEFLAIKQVLSHSKTIAEGPKLSPKEETKDKLDNLFDSTYGKSKKFVPFYLNPFIQIASAFVIGFAVWLFISKSNHPETIRMAENTVTKEKKMKQEKQPSENNNVQPIIPECEEIKQIVEVEVPPLIEEFSEDGLIPELTGGYLRLMDEQSLSHQAVPFDPPTDYSRKHTEEKNDLSFNAEEKAMEASGEKESRAFSKVSTPATSVRDISVEASKSLYKNQTVTSMNVAEQKNVMNYLVARY